MCSPLRYSAVHACSLRQKREMTLCTIHISSEDQEMWPKAYSWSIQPFTLHRYWSPLSILIWTQSTNQEGSINLFQFYSCNDFDLPSLFSGPKTKLAFKQTRDAGVRMPLIWWMTCFLAPQLLYLSCQGRRQKNGYLWRHMKQIVLNILIKLVWI